MPGADLFCELYGMSSAFSAVQAFGLPSKARAFHRRERRRTFQRRTERKPDLVRTVHENLASRVFGMRNRLHVVLLCCSYANMRTTMYVQCSNLRRIIDAKLGVKIARRASPQNALCGAGNGPGFDDRPRGRGKSSSAKNMRVLRACKRASTTFQSLARRLNDLQYHEPVEPAANDPQAISLRHRLSLCSFCHGIRFPMRFVRRMEHHFGGRVRRTTPELRRRLPGLLQAQCASRRVRQLVGRNSSSPRNWSENRFKSLNHQATRRYTKEDRTAVSYLRVLRGSSVSGRHSRRNRLAL